MDETEFKEKARKHIFNCDLRVFPTVIEMYARAFNLKVDNIDETMAQIVAIIRESKDANTAYQLVCHYLDGLESQDLHGP